MGMLIDSCKNNDRPSAEILVQGKLARHLCLQSKFLVNIYIYRYVRHTFVARSWGDVMWEEFSVSHF